MNIVFLCTANSCRSILSEAVFNAMAPSTMRAYSAGSHPSGRVNPLSLQALERAGVSTLGLSSKALEVHQDKRLDFLITVCDKASGEICPVMFSSAQKVHWGLEDPSERAGSSTQVEQAFDACVATIKRRIQAFLVLPLAELSSAQLAEKMLEIGTLR